MIRRAWWVVLTLAVVIAAQWMTARGQAGLVVEKEMVAGNPTLYVAAVGESRGVVLVLHGFGGSKEMMQHWGHALARRGFDAYIPDLPGHGAQTAPLADPGAAVSRMVAELVAAGRAEPERVALLDHANRNPLAPLYDEAAVARVADGLYRAFGAEPPAASPSPRSLVWLLLGLTGGLGAMFAVAALVQPGSRAGSRRQRPIGLITGLAGVAVSLLSAVLAAVYLRVPQVGVAVLDYMVPYFLVAAAVLLLLRVLWPREFGAPPWGGEERLWAAVLRGLAVALAFLGALVPVIHQNVTYFVPTVPRILPLVAMGLTYGLYAVQEEGLKRAVAGGPSPGGFLMGLAAKALMAATWMGAGVLPHPPEHLPAVVPVAVAVLVALEIVNWALGALRLSAVSVALVNAVVVGWTAALLLPLV